MLIYSVIREKKQRSRGSEGCTVFISEFYMLHTIPTQPVIQSPPRSGEFFSLFVQSVLENGTILF
jgi:hypothetical protein